MNFANHIDKKNDFFLFNIQKDKNVSDYNIITKTMVK